MSRRAARLFAGMSVFLDQSLTLFLYSRNVIPSVIVGIGIVVLVVLHGAGHEGIPGGGCLSTDCGREDWLARVLDLLSTVEAVELVWLREPTGVLCSDWVGWRTGGLSWLEGWMTGELGWLGGWMVARILAIFSSIIFNLRSDSSLPC